MAFSLTVQKNILNTLKANTAGQFLQRSEVTKPRSNIEGFLNLNLIIIIKKQNYLRNKY